MQGKDDEKRKNNFLSSQVVPSPGTQVAFWTVTDPDGDNVLCTFSLRREGDPKWTDLAVDSRESYVAFDTARLRDGIYFTRLVAKETAPARAGGAPLRHLRDRRSGRRPYSARNPRGLRRPAGRQPWS